jgi:hypothetical protein
MQYLGPSCHINGSEAELSELRTQLQSGQVWVVNSRRRNGLIICKRFHTEFAGPGAAVGSVFDRDLQTVIPIGDFSLTMPKSLEERHNAYLIRRQWIRLMQQFTNTPIALQRAQMLLRQFENYFDAETVAQLPDEALALMVGVLPYTITMARHLSR